MQLHFPHDDHAERGVLGAVLLDPNECWHVASDQLRVSDFYAPRHAEIWRAMAALVKSGGAIDLVLLRSQLLLTDKLEQAGGDEYLIGLTDTIPTTAHTAQMAKRVHELSLVREVMRASLRIAEEGAEPIDDVDDYLDRASHVLAGVCETRASKLNVTTLPDVLDESYSDLARRQQAGQSLLGHPTGLHLLDRATSGFVPGDLIVLAGRPGMGKTALANAIKLGIARSTKRAVLSLELEMTGQQLAHRLLAAEGSVDLRHIRSAKLTAQELQDLAITADELSRLPIFFIERRDTRISELRRAARRVVHQHGPLALVVIDYLQIARPEKRDSNRAQEVSEISGALKSLAGEFGCPVLALSQLNRKVESRHGAERRPILSDLRESGAIEQDADTVLFIHREELYDASTPDKGIAEVIIAKQRSGPLGTLRFAWRSEFTAFANLAYAEHDRQESLGYDEQPRSNGRTYE